MWDGGHPGTGVTIRRSGVPGDLTTTTITTDTILTGITIIIAITVTGTAIGAITIILTIETMCACTVTG
jgi:hypothetical protein